MRSIPAFHAGNRGSNPLGDATNKIKGLAKNCLPFCCFYWVKNWVNFNKIFWDFFLLTASWRHVYQYNCLPRRFRLSSAFGAGAPVGLSSAPPFVNRLDTSQPYGEYRDTPLTVFYATSHTGRSSYPLSKKNNISKKQTCSNIINSLIGGQVYVWLLLINAKGQT